MTTATPTEHHAAVDLLTTLVRSTTLRTACGSHGDRLALLTLDTADYRGEALAMHQVGARIGLSRAALTSLADRLERAGYARRELDAEDRRRVLLVITHEGRELVATAMQEVLA